MRAILSLCIFSFSLSLLASQLKPDGAVTHIRLSGDGKTDYCIVFADGENEGKAAALELQKQLQVLSKGAEFRLHSDNETISQPYISVGNTRQAMKLAVGAGLPANKHGFEIKVEQKNLYLVGQPEHNLAVMAFLEGDLNCRYFTDKISVLPISEQLDAEVVERVELAAFAERLVLTNYDLILYGDWAKHNRVMKWEHFKHPRDWFAHTYRKIAPLTEFAKSPELFSLVGGVPTNTMICPSQPENLRRFQEGIKAAMIANPNKKYFSVSESDGSYPYCQCQKCMETIRKYGEAPIAAHLRLVNETAKFVADRAPGQLVDFLVYSRDFRKPPEGMSLEDNVAAWFCSNGDVLKPNWQLPGRKEEFLAWRKLSKHMTVWDYSVNFGNYFEVVPSLPAKIENLRFFQEHDVEGIMIMEAYGYRAGDQQRLRAWMLAKLLWNPGLDDDELAKEFCQAVYAQAGEERLAYYNLVKEAGLAQKKIEEYYGYDKFLPQAERLFQLALAKPDINEAVRRELELDYLPILITQLNIWFDDYPNNKEQLPLAQYKQKLDELKRISSAHEVSHISELRKMQGYILEKDMLLSVLEGDGAFEVYAVNGRLYEYPTVVDELAVGGKATRQYCDGNWIVQWVIPTNLCEPGRKYQLSAEFRLGKDSELDNAAGCGLYNQKMKAMRFYHPLNANYLSSKEFRFVKIDKPFEPKNGDYVYFTAPSSSDIEELRVNRIRLVPLP